MRYTLPEREVHLWAGPLDAAQAAAHEEVIDHAERARASAFRLAADRERYVAAHGLLRRLLASYLPEAPQALRFCRGAQGKPELANDGGPRPISFNLSHTRRWVAVALARAMPVGVDVEQVDPALDVGGMAPVVLSRAEQAALAGVSPARRQRSFFVAWVCKEAVLKASGRGLAAGFGGVEVPADVLLAGGDGESASCVVSAGGETRLGDRWLVRGFSLAGDCVGAVAAPGADWTLRSFAFAGADGITGPEARPLPADAAVEGAPSVAR